MFQNSQECNTNIFVATINDPFAAILDFDNFVDE